MKSSTENSRREVEKCSVHRSGSSAHEGPHKGLVVSKKADLAHEVFTKEQGGVQGGGESRAKITRVSQTVQCIGSRLVKCLENLGGEGWGNEFGEVFERSGCDAGDRAVVHQKTLLGLLTDTFDIP